MSIKGSNVLPLVFEVSECLHPLFMKETGPLNNIRDIVLIIETGHLEDF